MKRILITVASAVFLAAAVGTCVIAAGGESENGILAGIINETHQANEASETGELAESESDDPTESESDDSIIIPSDAEKYGSIELNNLSDSPVTVHDAEGNSFEIAGTSNIDYSATLIFDNLGDENDFEVKGSNFYYKIKGNSIVSATVEPQEGFTLSGTDYSYEAGIELSDGSKTISVSGKCCDDLSFKRDQAEISLHSKVVIGDIVVSSKDADYHYQLNATGCTIKSNGDVTLKDGTKVSTAVENISGISDKTLVENVFHTIEPALFVRGNSSAIARAAAYINDYVYDADNSDAIVFDASAINEYYEYYGESGKLSFTITIYDSGNHARIATSDGEIHDYLIKPQEGAHCYPVFSL